MTDIHSNGWWFNIDEKDHIHDELLQESLLDFFKKENVTGVVDFGCGRGYYAKFLNDNNIPTDCYDGSPDTKTKTDGMCDVLDLAIDFDLNKQYDWVLCLEVGEHIPAKYFDAFIKNLCKHCNKGIVLSWAIKYQHGLGHVNCRSNQYIKNILSELGYINDIDAENKLRQNTVQKWFRNTIMVFRKSSEYKDNKIKNRMTNISIDDFYKTNQVPKDFDETLYSVTYPETKGFYQPYCDDNGIDEKHRLYFHYANYVLTKDQITKPDISNYNIPDISLVVCVKNRYNPLKIALQSWINQTAIKEIVIIDWDSQDIDSNYLSGLDDRIRIIRFEDKEYFHISKVYNIAIKEAKHDYIIKADVDYIFNGYYQLQHWLNLNWEKQFLTGYSGWHFLDLDFGFFKYLNGMIICKKQHILNAGMYDERFTNYGQEDEDLYKRLQQQNIERVLMPVYPNIVPVYHNPHEDYHRVEHYKNKEI